MQRQNQVSVGIDVGTTTVRCVVGVVGDDQSQPTIIGAGSARNRGMRKGIVNNVEEVAHAISMAVEEAERISGQHVHGASVSVNGGHIIGLNSKGVIAISNNNREIGLEDLERAEEAATVVQLPPNREILQVFAKSYHLDGQSNIKDPVGMSGVRLEVDAHIVTAATPAVKNLDRTFETADFRINHHFLSGLASAESVLDPKQRESGTVVVDLGAGTTNVVVVEEDEVQHVAVLPVGSINITNDLAIGLKTDLEVAEEVKLKHATVYSGGDRKRARVEVKLDKETYRFNREEVDGIVEARLEEIFELVDDELNKINRSGKLPGGVVLCGGGSKLPGIAELVKEKMQLPARVSNPKHYTGIIDNTDTPEYAAAVGLMQLDMQLNQLTHHGGGGGGFSLDVGSWFGSAKSFVDRFIPR